MYCIVKIWRPEELREEVDVMLANRVIVPLRDLETSARSLLTFVWQS